MYVYYVLHKNAGHWYIIHALYCSRTHHNCLHVTLSSALMCAYLRGICMYTIYVTWALCVLRLNSKLINSAKHSAHSSAPTRKWYGIRLLGSSAYKLSVPSAWCLCVLPPKTTRSHFTIAAELQQNILSLAQARQRQFRAAVYDDGYREYTIHRAHISTSISMPRTSCRAGTRGTESVQKAARRSSDRWLILKAIRWWIQRPGIPCKRKAFTSSQADVHVRQLRYEYIYRA